MVRIRALDATSVKTGRGQVPATRSEDSKTYGGEEGVQAVGGPGMPSEAATPGDPLRRIACRACRWASILDPGAKRQKGVGSVALSFPAFAVLDDAEFDFFCSKMLASTSNAELYRNPRKGGPVIG